MRFIVAGFDGPIFFDETIAGIVVVKEDKLNTKELFTSRG